MSKYVPSPLRVQTPFSRGIYDLERLDGVLAVLLQMSCCRRGAVRMGRLQGGSTRDMDFLQAQQIGRTFISPSSALPSAFQSRLLLPQVVPSSTTLLPQPKGANHTLSEAGVSLMKRCPIIGSLERISWRTLGTSPKKKTAKIPAAAPKPPRVMPLLCCQYSSLPTLWLRRHRHFHIY